MQGAADVFARGVAFFEGAVEGKQAVVGLCHTTLTQPFGEVAQHGQGFFLGGKQGDEAIGIAGGDGAAFAQGEGFIGHVLGLPSIFGGGNLNGTPRGCQVWLYFLLIDAGQSLHFDTSLQF